MSYETVRQMLIDLYDTTEGEVVYWEVKEQLAKPETKSIDNVRALQERMRGIPCEELYPVIHLYKGSRLIRSRQGDCYYYVSTKDKFCSCPKFAQDHTCEHLLHAQDTSTIESKRVEDYAC